MTIPQLYLRQREDSMKTRILGVFSGIALLLSAGSVYAGGPPPKPVKYLSAFACTFISTAITFDGGLNFASDNTCTGHDTFGIFNSQGIDAYYYDGGDCTAPDGTPGYHFTLEFATSASTYNFGSDQTWYYSVTGNLCSSPTTLSFGGSITYTISGGSGFFTGATGTVTAPFTGSFLYAAAGAGQTGNFGRFTGSATGTITP